jgi:hypothetical protein
MFRWITLACFAAAAGALMLHHLLFPCGYEKRMGLGVFIRKTVHLMTTLFLPQRLNWPGRFLKLAFLLGLLSFLVMLVTGFGPLLLGTRLQGWLLMIHATFAPVLIACAAVIAILGAGRFRFLKKDTQAAMICRKNRCCWLTDSGIGAKAGFWVLLFLSLPLTLTMVLSMLPLFGEDWQNFMFHAHRYIALVFTLTAVMELYMLARMEVRKDLNGCAG